MNFDSQKKIYHNAIRLIEANEIYKKIVCEVGTDTIILLSPHASTGDAYIIGALIHEYAAAHGFERFVYLCVGTQCAKIVSGMFGVNNILLISFRERDLLEDLYRFCGEDKCNIRVMHYQGLCMYTGILANLRTFNNIDFLSMLYYGAFRLPKNVQLKPPHFVNNADFADAIFNGYVEEGNSVIIAPVAGSIAGLPNQFWEKLVIALINSGYKVYTNISGGGEQVIMRTRGLWFPLSCADQVCHRAGYFVGYRSGLCDIISSVECKKVVLYDPNLHFGVGTYKDYFGLSNMGLTQDVLEVDYYAASENSIIESIINYFKS